MTPARARQIAVELIDHAAEEEAEAAPERPRKHAVTVVWCEGDEPHEAETLGFSVDAHVEFVARVAALYPAGRDLQPSPAPDAAKARAALVKMAAKSVCPRPRGDGWFGPSGSVATKAEAISDACEVSGCPVPPAEVEAILKEGEGGK